MILFAGIQNDPKMGKVQLLLGGYEESISKLVDNIYDV